MHIDINLVSYRYKQVRKVRKILYVCLFALSAWLLLNFYGYVTTKGELEHCKQRLERLSLQAPAAKLKLEGSPLDSLDHAEIKKIERRVAFLNQIIYQDAFSWAGIFNELEEITPEEICLSTFEADFKERRLHITGEAKSGSNITELLKKLPKVKSVQNCFLVSQKTEEKNNQIWFEIKGELRHITYEL